MALIPSFIPGADSINTAITDFLEGGVVGIDTIRSIDYGAAYLWTLDFIETDGLKPPSPFDRFFPASEVTLNLGILNTQTIDLGQTAIPIPKNTSFKSIDITFYDDDSQSLQKWMRDWINLDILNDGQYMSGLNDKHPMVVADSFGGTRNVQPSRQLKLALLDKFKEEALVYNYLVSPEGTLDFQGSQAADATQFQMKFNIIQELGKPKNTDTGIFADIKKQLGQFIGRLF